MQEAKLRVQLSKLGSRIDEFLGGRLDAEALKADRVPLGVYEQRRSGTFMVRVRCPGGALRPAHLQLLAELATSHDARLHITTRQEMQLHGVALTAVMPILHRLLDAGLVTKGTGGNTIRNITASPRSGVDPGEVLDVTAYATALTNRLSELQLPGLPRKFKIAFAKDAGDDVGARFHDLGFIAKRERDAAGFEVYVAGGLGTRPRVASLLHTFLPAHDVLLVAAAIVRVFAKYGDRRNRHAARLRFLIEKLGRDRFLALYGFELEQVRKEIKEPLTADASSSVPSPPASAGSSAQGAAEELLWRKRYVLPQRQMGRFTVLIPVSAGDLSAEAARLLASVAEDCGDDSLRFTLSQNVLLRHVPEAALPLVYARLRALFPLVDAPLLVAESVACAGAGTCQLGICLSKNVLSAIHLALANAPELELDAATGMRVHVSGCPNNCGRHSLADLGFYGRAKRVEDRLLPAYRVVAGACFGQGARLSEDLGDVHARQVPDLVLAAIRAFAAGRKRAEPYSAWFARQGRTHLLRLIHELSSQAIPATDSALDWGSEEIFSLAGRGEGECSAGP